MAAAAGAGESAERLSSHRPAHRYGSAQPAWAPATKNSTTHECARRCLLNCPAFGEGIAMGLRATVLVAGLLWPVSAFADFQNGNSLFEKCSATANHFDSTYCLGYVAGMTDAYAYAKSVCPPNGFTLGQSVDVVVKYLRDHPEDRHYTAASEVALALEHAFPCK